MGITVRTPTRVRDVLAALPAGSAPGPDHYVAAGQLVALAMVPDVLDGDADRMLAAAAVHAQLAAVAVDALKLGTGQLPQDDFQAWDQVAGVFPETRVAGLDDGARGGT